MLGNLRGRRGWILIDALAGALIVTIALGAIAMAFTQASGTAANATNYVRAVYFAQQALEDLKRQIDGKDAIPAVTAPALPDKTFTVQYNGPAAVTDRLGKTVDKLYRYDAVVSWTEKGQQRQVAVTGYYYLK